jgi:hypothetical protein
MKKLEMSWKTEDGRLVCHWIECGAGAGEVFGFHEDGLRCGSGRLLIFDSADRQISYRAWTPRPRAL